ncbi:serine/threonine-protein kinase [Paraliomyxa miuraensis]|uniref:serine/threonine-protein kinase n=1 Tax=Paraliomyxa miuraensis TaxID=376150 RepID=UPI002253C20F|nr:serine/threonine-protein kinase [Paraliomyxa miuraensis]MCX4242508.1 serine/threonine-protein kinase [Paraliomyxa miuraensis]
MHDEGVRSFGAPGTRAPCSRLSTGQGPGKASIANALPPRMPLRWTFRVAHEARPRLPIPPSIDMIVSAPGATNLPQHRSAAPMTPSPDDDELAPPDDSFELSQARPFDDDEIDDIEGQQLLARLESALFGRELQPQRLGRWIILERIGSGGMGIVYSAYDPKLDRRVALKVLRADRGDHGDAHARMLREAQALARISDPHVVGVHDVEELDDNICLVMELIAGPTLRQWQDKPRPRREIIECYVKVAHGLAKIHEAGLVHRDVKPDNVLLQGSRVVIADFGLVFADTDGPGEGRAAVRGAQPTALQLSLTAEGALVGTLGYMAPEQLAGAAAGPQSDQFGFFVSLYEALTGTRPFRGKTPTEIVEAMLSGSLPRAPQGAPLPRWLHRILQRGLATEADDRFASMAEVEVALTRGLRRGQRARVIAIIVGGLGLMGWFGLRGQPEDPCLRAPGELSSIWGDERRAELRAQVGRTDDPLREEAWAEVEGAFDQATAKWLKAWQAACHDRRQPQTTPESRLLAVAMDACVRDVQSRLAGFSREFSRSPAPQPESVRELTTELEQLDDCVDARVLAQYQRMLGLEQEPRQAQVLRDELGIAHARELLGDHSEALRLADEVLRKAQAPGLERIRAEAAYRRGRNASTLGRAREAQQSLEEAIELASATHDHLLGAMTSIYLAKLHANDPLGGRGGHGWLLLASSELQALHRLGSRDFLDADFLDASGIVQYEDRNYDQAEQLHRRALAIRSGLATSEDDPDIIRSKNNLASVLSHLGPDRKDEALALYQDAHASVIRMYGEDHPLNAELWINIGIQHDDAGRTEKAEEAFRAAIRIDRSVRDSTGAPALRALVLLGKLAADRDDAEALDAIARQLGENHAQLQASDPDAMARIERVNELRIIAQARVDDDVPAAIDALRRAAAIAKSTDPVEHAWTLVALADLESAAGHGSEARSYLQQALEVLRSHDDPVNAPARAELEAQLASLGAPP